MKPRLLVKYNEEIKPRLQKTLGIKNVMDVPSLSKVTLNIGMGDAHANPKSLEIAIKELEQITGQKPVKTLSRKSIAGFKIREGMVLGCMVTLRRKKMYEFLDRLINLSLPRVRDFRGLSPKAFDGHGNYNVSIREQIIFPEIDFDKVDSVHGLNISIVSSTDNDEHARELLKEFSMPFRKQ